jgi:hydrogenase-4 component F
VGRDRGHDLVSALLVRFSRTQQAIEAAWKYLISLDRVGRAPGALVYASSIGVLGETSDALAWTRLVEVAAQLDPAYVRLAFVFALAGYGTKAGLAPFHTWLPDAHSQAPSPISALLSGAALAVSLYALARFHLVASGTLGPGFSATLLVVFGMLSLAVALRSSWQGDLQRLLATPRSSTSASRRSPSARRAPRPARLHAPPRKPWAHEIDHLLAASACCRAGSRVASGG